MKRISYYITYILFIPIGCITPIDFELPAEDTQYVIEGRITNQEPPYIVTLSKTIDINSDTLRKIPVSDAQIILYDTQGNSEVFEEIEPGHYETNGYMQGTIGRSYYITVDTKDGSSFESEPELLKPVGRINNLRYEFEGRTRLEDFGEVRSDVFNIFIDARGGEEEQPLIRWRLTGIYKVETFPALFEVINPPYAPLKAPLPCSGFIVDEGPLFSGGVLKQVGPCTCCTCWVYQYEDLPQLSDEYIVDDNLFQNIKVGEIPITNYTFHDKYRVEVEQMSLSENAFSFFKSIRSQKLGASDLFQPQVGELKGNVKRIRGTGTAIGLFYATSIHKASVFISKNDVPYAVPPNTFITRACDDAYLNATNEKPATWID